MEFIEAPALRVIWRTIEHEATKNCSQAGANPELGAVYAGHRRISKAALGDIRRGKGRRGGLRLFYYHFRFRQPDLVITLYDKDKASDLTTKKTKALKAAIESELAARAARGSLAHRRARTRYGEA